jgi:hypothetical protein
LSISLAEPALSGQRRALLRQKEKDDALHVGTRKRAALQNLLMDGYSEPDHLIVQACRRAATEWSRSHATQLTHTSISSYTTSGNVRKSLHPRYGSPPVISEQFLDTQFQARHAMAKATGRHSREPRDTQACYCELEHHSLIVMCSMPVSLTYVCPTFAPTTCVMLHVQPPPRNERMPPMTRLKPCTV